MKGITPRCFGNHPPHRVHPQRLPQQIVGGNRWDASLAYASPPHVATWEVMKLVIPKSRRQDWPLAHETSPVSGPSVVGMTCGACQEPSNMPAGIPGVLTALAQVDRLHPKGRLHQ
jgi:hypothetical protein